MYICTVEYFIYPFKVLVIGRDFIVDNKRYGIEVELCTSFPKLEKL